MPFWSKKCKERAEPESSSSARAAALDDIDDVWRLRSAGVKLPDDLVKVFSDKWEAEFERRRLLALNVKKVYGDCSSEHLGAEEAALEASPRLSAR